MVSSFLLAISWKPESCVESWSICSWFGRGRQTSLLLPMFQRRWKARQTRPHDTAFRCSEPDDYDDNLWGQKITREHMEREVYLAVIQQPWYLLFTLPRLRSSRSTCAVLSLIPSKIIPGWHIEPGICIDWPSEPSRRGLPRREELSTMRSSFCLTTKEPNKSWADGKAQLSIWTAALYKRLYMLQDPSQGKSKILAMPLLVAQGHGWPLVFIS